MAQVVWPACSGSGDRRTGEPGETDTRRDVFIRPPRGREDGARAYIHASRVETVNHTHSTYKTVRGNWIPTTIKIIITASLSLASSIE